MDHSHGYTFALDEELTTGDLVAVMVTTPSGKRVQLWAEVEIRDRVIVLRQFAIYGVDAGPRELGLRALRNLAHAALEVFNVDIIRIEEARRTAGANPGRTVPSIEFRRRTR